MIIKNIKVAKFRGFENIEFNIGSSITVIAGQNGTQKTTLLGLLSQPFSISMDKHPLFGEKPLCGGNFKSGFSDKFKLSEKFDKVKQHEWTLSLIDGEEFTVESIYRDKSKSEELRFWKKGEKGKGSGYIPHPVVYLSLSRLLPIGEDNELNPNNDINLTNDEKNLYMEWHNRILLLFETRTEVEYLSSKQKNTLGINTDTYDWKQNSAGQDNIGKILLAILSFARLKKKYPKVYKGGILVIDEVDATLFPASQVELFDVLLNLSSDYSVQIILTTHSLSLLKHAFTRKEKMKGGIIEIVYLKKIDLQVKVLNKLTYNDIEHILNATSEKKKKPLHRIIDIFSEDDEARKLFKSLLGRNKTQYFNVIRISFSINELIPLALKKIPCLSLPNCVILVDGDICKKDKKNIKKVNNILTLPGGNSPEKLIATFFYNLKDIDQAWDIFPDHYSKQVLFRGKFDYPKIMYDRNIAKEWFKKFSPDWGQNCNKVINHWVKINPIDYNSFMKDVDNIIETYCK